MEELSVRWFFDEALIEFYPKLVFGVCCASDSANFGFRLRNQVFVANRLDESFRFRMFSQGL